MSLTHGHFYIAEIFLHDVDGPLRDIISENKDDYYMGSLAPDALYWSERVANLIPGYALADPHLGDTGKLTFSLLETAIRHLEKNDPHARACMAFAFGWATHWAADLLIHALVDKYGGQYDACEQRHVQLELVETKHIYEKLKPRNCSPTRFGFSDAGAIQAFFVEAFGSAYLVHGGGYQAGSSPQDLPQGWMNIAGFVAMERAFQAAESGCANPFQDTVIPAEYAQLALNVGRILVSLRTHGLVGPMVMDLDHSSRTAPAIAWASKSSFIPSDTTFKKLVDPFQLDITTAAERIEVKITVQDLGLYGRFLADHEGFARAAVTKCKAIAGVLNDFLARAVTGNASGGRPPSADDWVDGGFRQRLAIQFYDRNKWQQQRLGAATGAPTAGTPSFDAVEAVFDKYGIRILVPNEWGVHERLLERYGPKLFSANKMWTNLPFDVEQGIAALIAREYGIQTLIPDQHGAMLAALSPDVASVLEMEPGLFDTGVARGKLNCEFLLEFADGERPPATLSETLKITAQNAIYISEVGECTFAHTFENPEKRPYLFKIKVFFSDDPSMMSEKYNNIEYKTIEGVHADIDMVRQATSIEVCYRGRLCTSRDEEQANAPPAPVGSFFQSTLPTAKIEVDTREAPREGRESRITWNGDQFSAEMKEEEYYRPVAMPGGPEPPKCARRTHAITVSGLVNFKQKTVTFTAVEESTDRCTYGDIDYDYLSSSSFTATDVAIIDLDEQGNSAEFGVETAAGMKNAKAGYRQATKIRDGLGLKPEGELVEVWSPEDEQDDQSQTLSITFRRQ